MATCATFVNCVYTIPVFVRTVCSAVRIAPVFVCTSFVSKTSYPVKNLFCTIAVLLRFYHLHTQFLLSPSCLPQTSVPLLCSCWGLDGVRQTWVGPGCGFDRAGLSRVERSVGRSAARSMVWSLARWPPPPVARGVFICRRQSVT